jgi:hypothetical protein
MPDPLVLVVTHPADVHAEAVAVQLAARGVRMYQLDTAVIGTEVPITARFGRTGVTGYLGEVALEQVTCVWHRRPSDFTVTDAAAVAELRAGIGGLLACLPHLNHPVAMAAAHKPLQLARAAQAGLSVPESLVSSQPRAAAGMAEQAAGHVLVKPMSRRLAGLVVDGDRSGWSRPVHLTQRRVAKEYDVRVTVVDGALFAVRIDSPHLDWRQDLRACRYEVTHTPLQVAAGLRRLLAELRLRYATADFTVDQAGRWWFLEANPNGQWLWLEHATGVPISEAVATALANVPDDLEEPTIRPIDAIDLCAEPYPTRHEALAVARQLRAAGWVVVEHTGDQTTRPDGALVVASVYHPASYDSPGDVVAAR